MADSGDRRLIFTSDFRVVGLSGDVGHHGRTVMATRAELSFETDFENDCAPLVDRSACLRHPRAARIPSEASHGNHHPHGAGWSAGSDRRGFVRI
jgi:hypothetical protein